MNLRQLADLLNLSQTTVSRALNGYPEVREETRKRVLQAAEEHGYRPNARARSLATGRSMAIGHVIPMRNRNEMLNVVFSDFIAGAGEVYGSEGYAMMVSVVPDTEEADAYRRIVQQGTADGFIVHGPVREDPRLALLTELGVPFVVHGRSTGFEGDYSWLDVNNRRAIERATRYLIDLGHRRIGLVNGPEHMDFALRRREGYLAALAAARIAEDGEIMASGQMTEPYGFAAASAMLDLPAPPTAFVSSAIVPTLGIRRAAEERGLRLRRDISVICYDDCIGALPNGGPEGPIFTATRSSVQDAGRRCARMLIDRIEDPDRPHEHELWEADLVLGDSTAVATGRTIA